MAPLYTIGHGTRSLEELIAALQGVAATTLVDVRRFPGSRRHPHFARESLERALPRVDIEYRWWGEQLGGRRSRSAPATRHSALRNRSFAAYADFMDTDVFRAAIDDLLDLATVATAAVMCAETLWWRCHRRHIADAIALRGIEVTHVLGVGKTQAHKIHPALRCDDEGRPVYDVGETAPLL